MHTRRIRFAALVAVVMAGAALCQARVFVRWGAVAQSDRALQSTGGEKAYEADVNLNGGEGHLSVFRFDKPLADVVRELGRTFQGAAIEHSGGRMARASFSADGRTVRLTAIQLGRTEQTLVFSLDQAEADARRAGPVPSVRDLPAYPGSEPVFFAEDERARMAMGVAEAPGDPAAAAQFFREGLAQRGWAPALPVNDDAQMPSLSLYVKGNQTCCVLVERAAKTGLCRITLLYKRPGMQ